MKKNKPKTDNAGKRVLHLSQVENKRVIYGTVKSIETVSASIEYWSVQTDQGLMIEAPSTAFQLWEYDELHPGDHVKYFLDAGGYWEGVIRAPISHLGDVFFIVEITSWEHGAIATHVGYQFSERPGRFRKM